LQPSSKNRALQRDHDVFASFTLVIAGEPDLECHQLRVAESAGAAADDPRWREAAQSLQEAERRELAGDDAGRLHYRLAKLAFHTRDDPQKVVDQLEKYKDLADDRAPLAKSANNVCTSRARASRPFTR